MTFSPFRGWSFLSWHLPCWKLRPVHALPTPHATPPLNGEGCPVQGRFLMTLSGYRPLRPNEQRLTGSPPADFRSQSDRDKLDRCLR